jgi:hypothetical protein
MTTDRRRPAAAGRVLVGGISAAAALALIAGWSADADAGADAVERAAAQPLRVVITDPAIDPDIAVAAALDAHARGLDRTSVPVTQPPSVSDPTPQTAAGHSATHAS